MSRFSSWGGLVANQATPLDPAQWRSALPCLSYGNGRSYGDSGLLSHGGMIETQRRKRLLSFNAATGVIEAESGLLIGDLLAETVPKGWFIPVTPGTRFVTLGGALANDVHGKNHHAKGSFGSHVLGFDLERSDGTTAQLTPRDQTGLFAATIGGMGLTGYVPRLSLQLMPVESQAIDQEAIAFDNLDGFFEKAAASDKSHEYTVAWIDSLAKGSRLGSGILFRGNHARAGTLANAPAGTWKSLPFTPPVPLLNPLSIRLFNMAYGFSNRRKVAGAVHYEPFFYPLDGVRHWNRAYGPKGLRQHQSVVPLAGAKAAVAALIEATHSAGIASFLTVLKLFGDKPSPGMLSFPMPGATLTLDFPYQGERTDRLLAKLDSITLKAGGRVNPYKDARMPRETFEASFPQVKAFEAFVDPAFSSDFWRRVRV
jgi:FAD/FMN-containing dehydrogenase